MIVIFLECCTFEKCLSLCVTLASFYSVREINIDSIQAPEPRIRDEFLQCESPPIELLLTDLIQSEKQFSLKSKRREKIIRKHYTSRLFSLSIAHGNRIE